MITERLAAYFLDVPRNELPDYQDWMTMDEREVVRRAKRWRPSLPSINDDAIQDLRLQIAGIKATINEISADIDDILRRMKEERRQKRRSDSTTAMRDDWIVSSVTTTDWKGSGG